jgi:hypothetical protein
MFWGEGDWLGVGGGGTKHFISFEGGIKYFPTLLGGAKFDGRILESSTPPVHILYDWSLRQVKKNQVGHTAAHCSLMG